MVFEEGMWASKTKGSVTSRSVVKGFDVVEEGTGSSGFGSEGGVVLNKLGLDGSEGAFSKRVVVAVAGGAHALDQPRTSQEVPGDAGGILATAIGVEEGAWSDQAGVESTP